MSEMDRLIQRIEESVWSVFMKCYVVHHITQDELDCLITLRKDNEELKKEKVVAVAECLKEIIQHKITKDDNKELRKRVEVLEGLVTVRVGAKLKDDRDRYLAALEEVVGVASEIVDTFEVWRYEVGEQGGEYARVYDVLSTVLAKYREVE